MKTVPGTVRALTMLNLGGLTTVDPLSLDTEFPAFSAISSNLQIGPEPVQLSLSVCLGRLGDPAFSKVLIAGASSIFSAVAVFVLKRQFRVQET